MYGFIRYYLIYDLEENYVYKISLSYNSLY